VPEVSGRTWKEFFRWYSSRQSRAQLVIMPVELAQLKKDAEFISEIEVEVFRLMIATMARGIGTDPLSSLEEFDSNNPHIIKP
jgi:hypothetical protein